MTEHPMETTFRTALWRQFGAAIDMLENALVACPDSLWRERLWSVPPPPEFPPHSRSSGMSPFMPSSGSTCISPAPGGGICSPCSLYPRSVDSVESLPERPYTKEELHAYLVSTRQKCHTKLLALTDEQAHRPVEYPWRGGSPSAFWSCNSTICATSRNMRPN